MTTGRFGILLFRGTGFIGAAIRAQTRSAYAHAAILLPDGTIIEALQFHGVRRRTFEEHEFADADLFDVPALSGDDWLDVYQFANDQVGKSYDYLGVLRFISRAPSAMRAKWFCSELVFSSIKSAGVDLLERTEPWEVSPGLLSRAPDLVWFPQRGQQLMLSEIRTLPRRAASVLRRR